MYRRVCFLIFLMAVLLAGCSQKESPLTKGENDYDQGAKAVKVLLLGIDTRGEENSRSDAILVAQINPEDNSLKVVSLMRDTYVRIPGYEKGFHKLNTAYYLGGKDLLEETIKENFGLAIDHTVTVDFKGFTQLVDTIVPDGIEVQVSQKIIDDMKLDTEPGTQFLHGEELLKYVRFRHDDENDFGRVKRQQEVLVKLKEAFSNQLSSVQNILSIPMRVNEVSEYVETDMTMPKLLSIASMLYTIPFEDIETMTIPVPEGFENKIYEHAGAVLQMDAQLNNAAITNFFNTPATVNN